MEILISTLPEDLAVDEAVLDVVQGTVEKIAEIYALKHHEVSITLTDDEHIHKLNKKYRQIDRATDVLSFALNEGEEPPIEGEEGINVLGDIIISLERAREQAEEYGHTFKREVAFLTTHGMLHLLGYDHIEEADRLVMRKQEELVMSALGLERELEE